MAREIMEMALAHALTARGKGVGMWRVGAGGAAERAGCAPEFWR